MVRRRGEVGFRRWRGEGWSEATAKETYGIFTLLTTFYPPQYFVCTTLTTVGHGDVLPPTLRYPVISRLLTTLLSITGIFVIGNIASLSLASSKSSREEESVVKLRRFLWIVGGLVGVGTVGIRTIGGTGWGMAAYVILQVREGARS